MRVGFPRQGEQTARRSRDGMRWMWLGGILKMWLRVAWTTPEREEAK